MDDVSSVALGCKIAGYEGTVVVGPDVLALANKVIELHCRLTLAEATARRYTRSSVDFGEEEGDDGDGS